MLIQKTYEYVYKPINSFEFFYVFIFLKKKFFQ